MSRKTGNRQMWIAALKTMRAQLEAVRNRIADYEVTDRHKSGEAYDQILQTLRDADQMPERALADMHEKWEPVVAGLLHCHPADRPPHPAALAVVHKINQVDLDKVHEQIMRLSQSVGTLASLRTGLAMSPTRPARGGVPDSALMQGIDRETAYMRHALNELHGMVTRLTRIAEGPAAKALLHGHAYELPNEEANND